MKPTIGRVVHFRLTAEQAKQINRLRVGSAEAGIAVPPAPFAPFGSLPERLWPDGAVRHVGNSVGEGSVVPLIITTIWPDEYKGEGYLAHHGPGTKYESDFGINGQAILDGNDSLWVCSAPQHSTLPGCWFWPPREAP